MPFEKGKSGNPKGRSKGAVNKSTTEFKDALNRLLEDSAPKMTQWLEDIAQDDPTKAFDILSKFAEYIHPKLSRSDVNLDATVKTVSDKLADMDEPD